MKILISSRLFYPQNDIGAIRPTNFAKWLSMMGHDVTVITSNIPEIESKNNFNFQVIRINQSIIITRMIHKVKESVEKRRYYGIKSQGYKHIESYNQLSLYLRIYQLLRSLRHQIYQFVIEYDWYCQSIKLIKKKYLKGSFEIVLSSYGPLGSHILGLKIYEKGYSTKWIADLRDNIQSNFYTKIGNYYNYRVEQKMMDKASAILVRSKGQAITLHKSLGSKLYDEKKITVLYNGYEKEIVPQHNPKRDKIMRITYTGQLYSGMRDFSFLFQCFSELYIDNKIDMNSIEINYAGYSGSIMKEQAIKYNLHRIVHDHGILDREAAIELQNKSDILVVLSWNTNQEQGILPGKFYEYMQSYKPIIAITSGDLSGAELTKMVEDMNLGIGCETNNNEIDLIRLKNYILVQYNNIMNDEPLIYSPIIEKMEAFHYKNIVRKLEGICKRTLECI